MKTGVILLHGRGGSSEDILGLRQYLDFPETEWRAPQAPGNSWYPYSFLELRERNEPKLSAALTMVYQTVQELVDTGIPKDRIVLAGFSQGACLATEYVARHAARYGGLIGFTGGLIGPPGTPFQFKGALDGTPVFLGSGDPDPHVPWERVEASASVLSALGGDVTLQRYPGMPHTVSAEELQEARKVLARAHQSR